MITPPPEPNIGEPIRATHITSIIRYMCAITPRDSGDIRAVPSHHGTSFILAGSNPANPSYSALVLTRRPSAGYAVDPSTPATANFVFCTFGTVNNLVPTNIDAPLTITETSYVAIKASTAPTTQPFGFVAAELIQAPAGEDGAVPEALITEPFAEDGTPPEFVFILLGRVVVDGDRRYIENTGKGSLVIALHITDLRCSDGDGPQTYRQLTYWRTEA